MKKKELIISIVLIVVSIILIITGVLGLKKNPNDNKTNNTKKETYTLKTFDAIINEDVTTMEASTFLPIKLIFYDENKIDSCNIKTKTCVKSTYILQDNQITIEYKDNMPFFGIFEYKKNGNELILIDNDKSLPKPINYVFVKEK